MAAVLDRPTWNQEGLIPAALHSQQLYTAWGESRYTSGTLPTRYTYTGQYSYANDFGLVFYGSRFYDPLLSRWTSPDAIIPSQTYPLSWDRFSYVFNNPVKYNDPSGHCPWCIGGLVLGGIAGAVIYASTSLTSGRDMSAGGFLTSVGMGAVGGALLGTGIGAATGIASFAAIGAGAGVLGSEIGYSVASGEDFSSPELITNATISGVTGAVTGVLGAPIGINPITNPILAGAGSILVDALGGAAQFGATELINGRTPTPEGLAISWGIGAVTSAIPSFIGPIRSRYANLLSSPTYGPFERFRQSLLPIAKKEAFWQAGSDSLRTGLIDILSNATPQ